MKAVELKEVDKAYHIHLQAFTNLRVKAQKKAGRNKTRPVYKDFKKFFDYEKAIKDVLGKSNEKENGLISTFKKFKKERR